MNSFYVNFRFISSACNYAGYLSSLTASNQNRLTSHSLCEGLYFRRQCLPSIGGFVSLGQPVLTDVEMVFHTLKEYFYDKSIKKSRMPFKIGSQMVPNRYRKVQQAIG
jgi:hypothetical protein